jgi:flagellar FliL protein
MVGKKKDAPATTDGADAAPAKSGGMMRLVMVGVMSLSIAAAGYFIGGRGGAEVPAVASPVIVEVEAKEPVIEEIVDLEAVNVNLTDGHYLRVAISLGVGHEEAKEGEEGADGGGSYGAEPEGEEAVFPTAPAADILLSTFAERSMAELSDGAGRNAARTELETRMKEYYGEEIIVTVFLTEFVMQ